MNLDILFCAALIQNQNQFEAEGFDWEIKKDETGKIVLESEYWDRGFPHTYLFQPLNPIGTSLGLRNEFIDFRDSNLIAGDLQYRILSTLAVPYEYRLLLYAIVKMPKQILNAELHVLRNRGDEIYGKLIEYVDLYEGSPLFYEDEWERFRKLKARQNKKLLQFGKKAKKVNSEI